MSSYRVAIDQTTQTIDRRAKFFRNLIVGVTFAGLVSILWAGITRSWLPLAGIFLLVPFCGLYLFIDGKLLEQWRYELLIAWVKKEIDFRALYDAVIPISTLPKGTVQSMLETLPSSGDLVAEQGVSASTRTAIAAVVTTIHTYRSSDIALKATGYTIAGGVLIFAATLWTWPPLLGAFAVGLIILLKKLGKTKRLKNTRERINTAQKEPDFNTEKFLKIVNKINWTPISASEKKTILENFPAHSKPS